MWYQCWMCRSQLQYALAVLSWCMLRNQWQNTAGVFQSETCTSSTTHQPFRPHESSIITYQNTPDLRSHSWDSCAQEFSQVTNLPLLWMLGKVTSKILQYSLTSEVEFFGFKQTPPAPCFPTSDINCSYQYANSLRNLNNHAAENDTHLVYSSAA